MSTYYNIAESVTSRSDLDPEMKWVVTNIANKLQIPPDKLPEGRYTFSISNVAAEMGLPRTTTFYRFRMLVELKVLKEKGTIRTTHGSVVIYEADGAMFGKLLSGELIIPAGLLGEVRRRRKAASATDEPASSPADTTPSGTDTASSPADIRISPADASTQIQYPNGSTQDAAIQSTAYTNSKVAVPSGSPATAFLAERLGVEIENLKKLAVRGNWPKEYLNHAIDRLIKNFGR